MSATLCAKCGDPIRADQARHMLWRDRGLRQVLVAEHVVCPRESAPSAPEKPTAA